MKYAKNFKPTKYGSEFILRAPRIKPTQYRNTSSLFRRTYTTSSSFSRLPRYALAGAGLVATGITGYFAFHYMPDSAMFYGLHTSSQIKTATVGERVVSKDESEERSKAVRTLQEHSSEDALSCASVMLYAVSDLFNLMGEVGSATIGTHYAEEIGPKLGLLPTNANLRRMADQETEYWLKQQGSFGSWVTADRRYGMLLEARNEWEKTLNPEQLEEWNNVKDKEMD